MFFVLLYFTLGLLIPLALNSPKSQKVCVNASGKEYKIQWTYSLVFAFMVTVLVRGIAYDTGTDYLYYSDYFYNVFKGAPDIWGEHTEFGYRYLVKFLTIISSRAEIFFVLSSAVFMYSILKLGSLFGRSVFYSLLVWPIFMFTFSMNLYRQYIAISFILIAVYFLHKKKLFWNVFFSFLAVSFHFSAIIIVLFVWGVSYFKRLYINKFIFIALILLTNFAAHVVNDTIFKAIDLFQIVFGMINSHAYSAENLVESMYESSFIQYIIMVSYIIWVWFADAICKQNKTFRFFYYLSVISFICYPIFQQEILSRINLYFFAFVPVFLGLLLYHYRHKKGDEIYIIVLPFGFYLIRYVYYLYSLGVSHPYVINI